MAGTAIHLHLPEDVAIEILARLPVRSLLRFKCVCKSWLALIRNPRFISKHLIYAPSIDDNARVVLKHWSMSLSRAYVSFLSLSNGAVSHDDIPMSMPFFDDDDGNLLMTEVIFYGPCNGIICAFGDHMPNQTSSYRTSDLISLWNPATREIKRLPISNVPHPDDHDVFFVEIGFGFDAMTNDYKVIKIIDFQHRETRRYRDSTLVEVYNLSTNCWRKIEQVVPTFMRIKYSWSTYLDGSYYWWSGDDNDDRLILSFSFADEVFEKIPPPDLKNPGIVTLLKYKESIALAADDSESLGISDCTAIWVLNKDGDKSTWDKLFIIKLVCLQIKGFLSNGEALIVKIVYEDEHNYKSQLVLYDPSSRQVKNLQVYDAVYEPVSLQLVNYAESLVSFTPQGNLRV